MSERFSPYRPEEDRLDSFYLPDFRCDAPDVDLMILSRTNETVITSRRNEPAMIALMRILQRSGLLPNERGARSTPKTELGQGSANLQADIEEEHYEDLEDVPDDIIVNLTISVQDQQDGPTPIERVVCSSGPDGITTVTGINTEGLAIELGAFGETGEIVD